MNATPAHVHLGRPRAARFTPLVLTLTAWFLAALVASLAGAYANTEGPGSLAMPFAILAPIGVFLLAYALSPRLRETVLGLDTRLLVLLHTWRMVGLGFLMLYAFELLPGVFAFPAGLGDAAAAAWALVLAAGLYGGFDVSRRHLLAWNGFGLADFVVAVTIGTLSRYGFLDAFTGALTTSVMGELPLVLIPTFVVPLLAITHIVVYLQVRNGRAAGLAHRRRVPSTAPEC